MVDTSTRNPVGFMTSSQENAPTEDRPQLMAAGLNCRTRLARTIGEFDNHEAHTGGLPFLFTHVRGCIPQSHAILQRRATAVRGDR